MVVDCSFISEDYPNVDSINQVLAKYLVVLRRKIRCVEEPSLYTCLAILEDDLVELMDECKSLMSESIEMDYAELESLEARALTVCEELSDLLKL